MRRLSLESAIGPLVTILIVIALSSASPAWLKLMSPLAGLMVAVTYSTLRAGTRSGLISAAITCSYLVYFFHKEGRFIGHPLEAWGHVGSWFLAAPLIVYMVGRLKKDLVSRDAAVKSEKTLKDFTETIPKLVWTATPDGSVDYFNQRWFDYTGLSPEQSIRYAWQSALHPDDVALCVETWLKAVATGSPYEGESRVKRATDGQYRWFLNRACPIRDENGRIVRWFGTSTDIDDQKTAEAERSGLVAREQSAAARAQFLANMSHEIRTPINAVTGMAALLLDTPLTPEQRKYSHAIRDSADLLLSLVNDILDFTKIEAGRMDLESIDFDLRLLLQEIEQSFSHALNKKGLRFVKAVADDVPEFLKGDPTRIRQVLLNLVNNAIKFTPAGELSLSVSADRSESDCRSLRFEVADTGVGIAPEAIDRLFKPFSQADSSMARRFGGTGLGLSICRNVIKLMDGEIGVRSRPGSGSTFWFTIPLHSGQRPGADPYLGLNEPISRSGLRVLVAEDNEINQLITLKMLEKIGCEPSAVANGFEAITSVESEPFDLILMDVQMPELDGYEATRRIRSSPVAGLDRIPIIALTANAMPGDRERCFQAGMNAYLSKPIRLRDLKEAIEKADFASQS